MNLEKILVVDDIEENRNAAREAIPNVELASSAKEALSLIETNQYDLVITDLGMEEPWSGLDVVRAAMHTGAVPYTFSGGHVNHGKPTVDLLPDYHGYIEGTKANPSTWKKVIELIGKEEGAARMYHRSIARMKPKANFILNPDVTFAMYGRKPELGPWLDIHKNEGQEKKYG